MNDVFDTKPICVNEKGVKWWLDESTTKYCIEKNALGKSLPKVIAYFVEMPDGTRTRLLVEGGKIIYDAQSLDEIACHIDILKRLKSK